MKVEAVVVEACTTCHEVDCNASRGTQMQADISLGRFACFAYKKRMGTIKMMSIQQNFNM